jgi:hypothetical protein
MSWETMRIWVAGKVVAEHFYDQSHEGPAIQYSDLDLKRFDATYFPDHRRYLPLALQPELNGNDRDVRLAC